MRRPLLLSLLLSLWLGCSGEEPPAADDADGDGYAAADDCDDDNRVVHPDATESCNEVDDDCDGTVDEDVQLAFWTDADGDGYGDPYTEDAGCLPGEGQVLNADDCDDTVISINPGAAEVCDGLDNNCSGAVDEGVMLTLYVDADGDGHGVEGTTGEGCGPGDGLADTADDCDDTNAAIHPDADESDCTDPTDYDCDGLSSYGDVDGDGWATCVDCDDEDATLSPGATEVCDDVDNDCDGEIDTDADPGDMTAWYHDADGDGYGDVSDVAYGCDAPAGYVSDGTDCNDDHRGVNPSIPEICDGFDDDCDGLTDEVC